MLKLKEIHVVFFKLQLAKALQKLINKWFTYCLIKNDLLIDNVSYTTWV